MKKKILVYTALLSLLFSSCESWIEIEPQNQLSANVVFTDIAAAGAVLNSAYNRFLLAGDGSLYGRDLKLMGDALADNILTDGDLSGQRYLSANRNDNMAHYNIWASSYLVINDVNEVIANTPNLTVTEAQEGTRNSILAQAYTIRALSFFNLARVYGYEPNKIPTTGQGSGFDRSAVIRLTPTNSLEDAQSINRSSILETYTQIESDLTQAIALFQNSTNPANPVRYFTLGTAYAIRGTVYLYWERYQDALSDFDLAFANSSAVLSNDIDAAFREVTHPEAFTQLWIDFATQSLGSNNSLYSYTHAPLWNGISTFGGQTVSPELYNSFNDPNDDRLNLIFVDSRHPQYRWSDKYNNSNGLYADNLIIVRYADVLLMRAEALATLGQYGQASAEIVRLRASRNASTASVPTGVGIVDYIKQERNRELNFEGMRYFDLKRWGQGVPKSASVVGGVGFLSHEDHRLLAPIPAAQATLNPSLPQNPGY
ncbi:RagB/SusD family nutrient uptake outer membrane protein [Sphingobacterium sp. lm-10]|uniref:RagB/SusD family nutrient uptake outer membrane protein n=1 Tax=Sphingobacterium sp. lm-10 TaxID=2944904 RepID=UPI00201FD69F|nr:RagB/SusD family nutrient uptake outer membrane protein [Sphingobacterium sp. lm-10]MCL7989325.1 RagB/SusD family nutrient uptake outer membrane protein [Sphingobacterium sp. lm-10]